MSTYLYLNIFLETLCVLNIEFKPFYGTINTINLDFMTECLPCSKSMLRFQPEVLVLVYRPDALLALLRSAVVKVDIIVTSGGVSMGEKVKRPVKLL